jgi:hypothetical protein
MNRRGACPNTAHALTPHMPMRFLDSSSAFQGRGPLTVLLLNVLAYRWFWSTERIDSRTRIPLFIVATTSVNEKQPFGEIFFKKLSVRSVSITYGKS